MTSLNVGVTLLVMAALMVAPFDVWFCIAVWWSVLHLWTAASARMEKPAPLPAPVPQDPRTRDADQ